MSPVRSLFILLCLFALIVSPHLAQGADTPSASEIYMEYRRWINAQPDGTRAGSQEDRLAAYSAYLADQGLTPAEIDSRRKLLVKEAEGQEVELWNRVLTAEAPRFNTNPNEFLVRMVAGRSVGRALDVGMGQGRNAIWLAQQGWDVTGFDPADRAVALAHELAVKAGVSIKTEIVGSEKFDWGSERWDLIVLSYVQVRPFVETILASLKPGGLVVLEAFHDDATKKASIGRGVVWDSNELLERFGDFRILHYEDTTAKADFGPGTTHVVRLLARKR